MICNTYITTGHDGGHLTFTWFQFRFWNSDSEIQILKWVLGQHRGKWELLTFDATQILASQWLASPFSILRALALAISGPTSLLIPFLALAEKRKTKTHPLKLMASWKSRQKLSFGIFFWLASSCVIRSKHVCEQCKCNMIQLV